MVGEAKSTDENYFVFWFIVSVIMCLFCLLIVCACGESSQKMCESLNLPEEHDKVIPVIHTKIPEKMMVVEVKPEKKAVKTKKRTKHKTVKKSKLTKAIERKKVKSAETTTESIC